ncbi:MAG: hypothetical protein ACFNZJ_05680 [Parascardovia denticolens]
MHQPFDLDPEVASTIITLIGSFLVAWLTSHVQSQAQQASTEHELSQALSEEQKRTGQLHKELIQVEDRLHAEHVKAVQLTDNLNSAIAYARQLGHYMDQVCARYGTFQGISKPHLPDDIRPQIEDTARHYGWENSGKT